MSLQGRRLELDAFKILASQLIVVHHFSAYGPLSDALYAFAPKLATLSIDYFRMAVQIFLVLGGFLAAKHFERHAPQNAVDLARQAARRYLRLAPSFVVALLLVATCGLLAGLWLQHDFIPAAPGAWQFLTHVLLLQGVLGVESLSLGVWYVAIDFQLFVMLALLMWLGRSRAAWLVALFMLVSLLVWNRDERLDNWALYFFGAYGLGCMAYWVGSARRHINLMLFIAAAGAVALVIDFRGRILLALSVALVLGLQQWRRGRSAGVSPGSVGTQAFWARCLVYFGDRSYALFLVHYGVLLLAKVVFALATDHSLSAVFTVFAGAWLACMLLASGFMRWVEQPIARSLARFGL
jgi:peptidoglycan/LPS O-acetylase OafA/YrhL